MQLNHVYKTFDPLIPVLKPQNSSFMIISV